MLSLEQAQARIIAAMPTLPSERVPVAAAMGRFAAERIVSGMNLPPFDKSAMDGYAVRAEDTRDARVDRPVPLRLCGRVAAGDTGTVPVTAGGCVRVFTGSPLPTGADAVVMQEDVRDAGTPDQVLVTDSVKPWENVRFRGEDVTSGARVLETGAQLRPGTISLLAALGISEVAVGRRPRIALLATGSELVEPGQPLHPGAIYESNRAGLAGMSALCGVEVRLYPLVKDELEATMAALDRAFAESDAVITSGGVSVGEHDFVKTALERLGGRLEFWRIAVKPGKPFVFGVREDRFLFGLPGNPVSALVTFHLLVRPAFLKMQGANDPLPQAFPAVAGEAFRNPGERRHFVRVKFGADGAILGAGPQASHILSGLAAADGLLDVPARAEIKAGDRVCVLLWNR